MIRWLGLVVLALAVVAGCHEETQVKFEPLTQVPSPCSPAGGGKWYSDEVSIANEIFAEQSNDLEFDHAGRDALASEIRGVLAQVRQALPVAVGIYAPPYRLSQIALKLTPEATAKLPVDVQAGAVARQLGLNAIDSLSELLGVREMYLHANENSPTATVELCLDDAVNVNAAIKEYTALEDVDSASALTVVGDGPALDMRKQGDTWHVVVREADGDCPAGCINETLHFLTVDDASVKTVPEAEATNDSLFGELVKHTRRNDMPWPSPSPTPVVS